MATSPGHKIEGFSSDFENKLVSPKSSVNDGYEIFSERSD